MAERPVEKKHSRKLSAKNPFEFAVKKGDKSPRITAGDNLFLHLQGGRNLVARDVTGSSDPYVVIQLGNKKLKSKTIQQTLFPRWNEIFAFEFLPTLEKNLRLTVMDWDRLTKDDFMGECSFDLSSLELDTPAKSEWISLEVSFFTPLFFSFSSFSSFSFFSLFFSQSFPLFFSSRVDQGNRIRSQGSFNCRSCM